MDQAVIATAVFSGFVAATMIGFFIWGLLTGQFKNVQETSRRMLRNNVQLTPEPDKETKNTNEENQSPKGGTRI